MRILVVNAGSSSLKLSVLDGGRLLTATTLSSAGGADAGAGEAADAEHAGAAGADGAIREIAGFAGRLDAVGHRIVHGGTEFTGPTLIDGGVRDRLAALTDLAPLHQPKSLAALDAALRALPGVPAVACFDTAFHATIPAAAASYALPREWRQRWPLRRFGFHGLSHAYAARRAAALSGRPAGQLRIVTCHLGAGASVTAVGGGTSVDTTMGFTPLEGLIMATRSGSVDPGLVLWLQQHARLTAGELSAALEHRSGLLGLAGTADMKEVLDAEARGDLEATLAVAVYLHRLRAAIAAMAAALGGLDVLVFTGGVGENSAAVRGRAAAGLGFLGVQVDPTGNGAARGDRDISTAGAAVRTLVIQAREDLEIAAEVEHVLSGETQASGPG